jgi:hypothetical protein
MSESLLGGFYGVPRRVAPDPKKNYRRFVKHLRWRRAHHRPVVIVIDGKEASVGKSALGYDICSDLDSAFALDKVVYTPEELNTGYGSPTPSMFLYDEGTLGLLANKGSRDDAARAIIGGSSIMRKNGHGAIFCAIKKELLDFLFVAGLANFWIFVNDRGRAQVNRAYIGAQRKRSQALVPFDAWNAVSPITWPNPDGTAWFRTYNERAKARNVEWFRLHALDPSGHLRECKKCGKLGSAYLIATHVCLGAAATTAPDPLSREGESGRATVSLPPPPRVFQCGHVTFARGDAYRRHLTSAMHLKGNCGGAREGSLTPRAAPATRTT